MAIKDIEDLQVKIRDYFKDNLNTFIQEVNSENPDDYVIDEIPSNSYILGEEIRGRQNLKVQFNVSRDDVVTESEGNAYVTKNSVNFLLSVLFYDRMTELDYRKGLRYEEAVYRCSQGITGISEELSGVQITRRYNNPVNSEGTPGIRISGAMVSLVYA